MAKGGKIVSTLDELRRTLRNNPEFANWFGKSQIVDAAGNPTVAYHGAPDARFAKEDGIFKTLKERYGHGPDPENRAFWFSADHGTALSYADDRRAFDYQNADPAVIRAFLKMENPLIVDGGGKQWREAQARGKTSDVIEQAKAAGHDGVIIQNVRDRYQNADTGKPTTTYTVFAPEQIKSVDNEGTFNPSDPSMHKAKGGRIVSAVEQLKREADYLEWIKGTKAVTPEGSPMTLYHGANRLDRLVDKIRPERSTSGPMPFFTANPEIASNYAKGKADNSIEDNDYKHWFQYRPKGARSDQLIDHLWWDMTPEQKKAFHERMPNIREDDEREHVLHDPEGGMAVPGTYEMYLQRERGNGIAAARELWLNSGALFGGDEHKFVNVLREAGAPLDNVSFTDFNHGAPGIMPAHLSIENPLVTSEIPPHVVEALDDAASRVRKPTAKYGADPWDKATRDPDEWMQALKTDLEEGTQLAWSSIPDWVTKTLTRLGYDGIHDFGGKLGGEKHDVWVPFTPEQVRSSITKKARGGRVGFAKGGKVARTAMDELKEYAHALSPQKGMFSTLDELVQQAPFEKGSVDQWRGYLKPGRMLKREGMEFPLKKEELDYAFEQPLRTTFGSEGRPSLTKDEVLEAIRKQRPEFHSGFATNHLNSAETIDQLGKLGDINTLDPQDANLLRSGARKLGTNRVQEYNPAFGPEFDRRYSHQSPDSVYEESMTRLPGINHSQHFSNDTLSHSRVSTHNIHGERNEAGHLLGPGRMRLVEEIQSDLHQDAAERMDKVYGGMDMLTPEELEQHQAISREREAEYNKNGQTKRYLDLLNQAYAIEAEGLKRVPRRGYITPEERAEFHELNTKRLGDAVQKLWKDETNDDWTPAMRDRRDQLAERLEYGVPDAPFKDAADYGRLELKKQLLNAAHNDEDYLAITRPEHQIERYSLEGDDAAAMEHIYGKVYISEMKKLAKQYGAEMTEVPLNVTTAAEDIRPDTMRDVGAEEMSDFLDQVYRGNYYGRHDPHEKIIDELQGEFPDSTPMFTAAEKARQAVAVHNEAAEANDGEYVEDEYTDLMDAMENLWSLYKNMRGSGTATNTKTFPAIKLTPEVRERIKKAGVSLWATGAGAAGLELLGHPDDASAEERTYKTEGGFAEGGTVDASQSLGDLVRASQALMASHRAPDPYRDPRLFDRFLNSYQGQWTGFDPSTGDISSMLDLTPAEAPTNEPAFRRHRGAGPLVTANASFHEPALTLGLRTLPEQLKASFAGEGLSEHPSEALQHLNAIESKMLEKDQLDPPEGLAENLFSNAGVVASQLPVPGDLISKGVAKLPAMARVALKAPAAVADFFGPTVHPTPRTVAEGAAAGTALGSGIGAWMDHRNQDDPWALAAAAVRNKQLPPEMAFQIANTLKPQPQDTLPSETEDAAAPKGLLKEGNIENLYDRPILENDDGSYSTTSSLSIGTDEGEVLIPTVIDGHRLTKEQAIQHYHETGEHLGIFSSAEDADAYAEDLHNRQAKYIEDKEFAEAF